MALIDDLKARFGLRRFKEPKLSRKPETEYARQLIEVVNRVRDRVANTIMPRLPDIWDSDNWPSLIESLVGSARDGVSLEISTALISSRWARNVQIAAGNRWEETLNRAFGVDVQALIATQPQQPQRDAVQAAINANVRKIKSIPAQYLDRVEEIITSYRQGGLTQAAAAKAIREVYPVSVRRARLIARDQTSKLAEAINRINQTQAGVTGYKWRGRLDDREREAHRRREGKIYTWDKPPPDGHPGQPVNCRCHAQPYFDDGEKS